jgi:hypothetical protein
MSHLNNDEFTCFQSMYNKILYQLMTTMVEVESNAKPHKTDIPSFPQRDFVAIVFFVIPDKRSAIRNPGRINSSGFPPARE